MITLDRLRDLPTVTHYLRTAGWGAATALVSALPVVLLVAFAIGQAPRGTATIWQSIGAGASAWLALGGGRLAIGTTTLAITPLAGFIGLVALAIAGANRSLDHDTALDRRQWAAWLGGYAVVGIIAAVLAAQGAAALTWLSAITPILLTPALGLAWSLARRHLLTDRIDALPRSLRRGVTHGLIGAAIALTAGSLVVIVVTLTSFSQVTRMQGDLGAGALGGTVLTLAQLLLLPNLGQWVLSFMAGPGYHLSETVRVTWSGVEPGVLPMLPILAAHPQPGAFPWPSRLFVLVPIALGIYLAHRTLRSMPRLAAGTAKVATVAWAVATTVIVLAFLDLIGGGSAGSLRLSTIGAPVMWASLALLAEMSIGAALLLAWHAVRQRRR